MSNISPRHIWYMERAKACLDALYELHYQNDWKNFRLHALELSKELSYAVNEWDKYYKENE